MAITKRTTSCMPPVALAYYGVYYSITHDLDDDDLEEEETVAGVLAAARAALSDMHPDDVGVAFVDAVPLDLCGRA